MSEHHLGWLYYKDLFNGHVLNPISVSNHNILDQWINFNGGANESEAVESLKKRISDFFLQSSLPERSLMVNANAGLHLKTTYPGLVIGSGYNHEAGIQSELKLGFYFDPTYGSPVIPGSTIKGILRSGFPVEIGKSDSDPVKKAKTEANKRKAEYIHQFLTKNGVTRPAKTEYSPQEKEELSYALRDCIFENLNTSENLVTNKRDAKSFRKSSERFVFYDAIIEKSDKNIFSDDYITPHLHKSEPRLNPFAEPVPLRFLRIVPEVVFNFQFKLHTIDVLGNSIDDKTILNLFSEIIQYLGVGAKTRLGYGYMLPINEEGSNRPIFEFIDARNPIATIAEINEFKGKIEKGAKLNAKIVDTVSKKVEINIKGKSIELVCSGLPRCAEIGVFVKCEITAITKNKEISAIKYTGPAGT